MNNDGQVELPYAFGPFLFDPQQRLLLREATPVPLGSRARDILLCLLERAGETVSKRELISQVWGGALVEEGTLRVHVAALRKALREGDGGVRYVENVTGIGYRFNALVSRGKAASLPAAGIGTERLAPALPLPLTRIVGRQQAVSTLKEGLQRSRLMTIVGPGGIGKTTVAVAAAEQLRGSYPGGVHYIDLGGDLEGDLGGDLGGDLHINSAAGQARTRISAAISAVLGLAAGGADDLGMRCSKPLLLVLDNCEHVVEAVACLVEKLLANAPYLNIMATSREPLRAHGEWVLRLEPLGLPPRELAVSASEALRFPAIELFADRARASIHTFELSDEAAPLVAEMCHRLDGLPLAIELAAARVQLLGVHGLAERFYDCLSVLTQGRRTAVRRHQSLRASLDWSYALLTPIEQRTLCKLAVFPGSFLASSALEVVAGPELDAPALVEVLGSLAAKSVLSVEDGPDNVRYRLLSCCRTYALEKFASAAERQATRRRHAELCCRWAREAAPGPDSSRRVADMRAALDWCFSPDGDPLLGLELTACCAPLWLRRLSCSGHHHGADTAGSGRPRHLACSPGPGAEPKQRPAGKAAAALDLRPLLVPPA